MTLVTPLGTVDRGDVAIAGGKGANLGHLLRAGVPVPDGFVVTTAAYSAYVTPFADQLIAGGDPAALRALFERPVPTGLAGVIEAEYARWGDPDILVAVRSSATVEDQPEASFAGQQDTFLGVGGADGVLDAVRRCWASLWTDRAIAYRAKAGIDPQSVRLAVVVQRLVPAEVAGVLFTANPANGRPHETVLNATHGLGEALVGGEVTPDEIVVGDGRVLHRRTETKKVRTVLADGGTRTVVTPARLVEAETITDAEAIELAAVGRRIEALFGAPQDIEWVLEKASDGSSSDPQNGSDAHSGARRLWIVQARPITALPPETGPVPVEWRVPRADGMYLRASIVEQMPDPLSPLFADLIGPAVKNSLADVVQRYLRTSRVGADDLDLVTVNGYAYCFYSNVGMWRMMRGALPGGFRLYAGGDNATGVKFWREEGRPAYVRTVAAWQDSDPRSLPARELLAGAETLISAGAEYYTYVQAVIPLASSAELIFTRLYGALVRRKGAPPALAYLLGLDSLPIRAERSLFALATWCREQPGVAEALRTGDQVPDDQAEQFTQRLDAHLAEFGHLTYNLDIMQPVAADDPAPVLAALRHALSGQGSDPDERIARQAHERARAIEWLADHVDPVRRAVLLKALRRAQLMVPLREDALADLGLGWPVARRLLRELGRRCVDAGLIAEADDVFWLTGAEVSAVVDWLDAGQTSPLPSRVSDVAQRKVAWRGQRLAQPPGWLPQKGFWFRAFRRFLPGNEAEQGGPQLKGLGASPGAVTAPARVLRGPEDFDTMRPGDVLVARITTPAYTPLFALAAGVVTDVGGPLSHSSIVAREYGIPAVLGTGSATHRISNGELITVDGDRGLVSLGARPGR